MMVDQEQSYIILARIEAAIGIAVAIGIFFAFAYMPEALSNSVLSFSAAIVGAAVAIYYVSLHQVFGKRWPQWSALIMTILTAAAVALVIEQTGGLSSPFYAFWLLVIATAGIFGLIATIVILSGTIVLSILDLFSHNFANHYLSSHVIQLVLTLIAGGLAEWIHSRNRLARVEQGAKVASLSGKLSAESMKTNALISSIGEGVVVVNCAREIQLFNQAAQTLTGWDEKSAQGIDYTLVLKLKDANDILAPPESDPFGKVMSTHEQVVDSSFTIETQGGRRIAAELSVSPIYDEHHAVSGAIGLFRDISAQKEVERQKDEFVSTASHEMRTPVAAIEGYLSLAMNPNVALIDDRANTYLTKAHDAVQHLGELFRDLLNVTKAEEGKLQGRSEAVNLTDIVRSAVDDMQFVVQKKNLSLVFQASSNGDIKAISPLYYVKGNPERLREVVMNLIDNAVKFTSTGGITVTILGTTKDVTVSIADTGVGIAAEDAAHLFQKFYRIDSSATRTIGGTGLGLYLCRTVIELSGGKIWVEGKPGIGSTFSFLLPRLSSIEIAKLEAITAASAESTSIATTPSLPVASIPANMTPVITAPSKTPAPSINLDQAPSTQPTVPQPQFTAVPQSGMAKTNPALTSNPAATIAAALAAHPPK
jgi:PAS domain S-box-containing protein